MGEQIVVALQITAVGMGLVFGMLALLWLVMTLLVRFFADGERVTVEETGAAKAVAEAALESARAEDGVKRRAAVAAVAVALAERAAGREAALRRRRPPTDTVSAWQAVMRAHHLAQRRPRR